MPAAIELVAPSAYDLRVVPPNIAATRRLSSEPGYLTGGRGGPSRVVSCFSTVAEPVDSLSYEPKLMGCGPIKYQRNTCSACDNALVTVTACGLVNYRSPN